MPVRGNCGVSGWSLNSGKGIEGELGPVMGLQAKNVDPSGGGEKGRK
jgi:hypothetical protein